MTLSLGLNRPQAKRIWTHLTGCSKIISLPSVVVSSVPRRSALSALFQRNCTREPERRSQTLSPEDPGGEERKKERGAQLLQSKTRNAKKSIGSTTIAHPCSSFSYKRMYPWKFIKSTSLPTLSGSPWPCSLVTYRPFSSSSVRRPFLEFFPGSVIGCLNTSTYTWDTWDVAQPTR